MRSRRTKPITAICLHCQKTFAFKFYGVGRAGHYNRYQKFCGRECAAEFQVKGWGTDKNGYKVSNRSNGERRVYVTQHRKIMEDFLGRSLTVDETVHHKNGDRADNRLENLELWSSRHGRGQRVTDKIDFSRSFLQEYQVDAPFFTQSDAMQGIAGLTS